MAEKPPPESAQPTSVSEALSRYVAPTAVTKGEDAGHVASKDLQCKNPCLPVPSSPEADTMETPLRPGIRRMQRAERSRGSPGHSPGHGLYFNIYIWAMAGSTGRPPATWFAHGPAFGVLRVVLEQYKYSLRQPSLFSYGLQPYLKCYLESNLNRARFWLYVGNHVEPEEELRNCAFYTLATQIYPKSRF